MSVFLRVSRGAEWKDTTLRFTCCKANCHFRQFCWVLKSEKIQMMRTFCHVFWCMMHQSASDPIQCSVWQTSYPGSDSATHGASTMLWGKASACPVVKSVLWLILGIARKARIKPGLLHASLVLPTNKIIHFYQVCTLSFTIGCIGQGRDQQALRERKWREEMKTGGGWGRETEGEREKPPSVLYMQSAELSSVNLFSRNRLLPWQSYLKVLMFS